MAYGREIQSSGLGFEIETEAETQAETETVVAVHDTPVQDVRLVGLRYLCFEIVVHTRVFETNLEAFLDGVIGALAWEEHFIKGEKQYCHVSAEDGKCRITAAGVARAQNLLQPSLCLLQRLFLVAGD